LVSQQIRWLFHFLVLISFNGFNRAGNIKWIVSICSAKHLALISEIIGVCSAKHYDRIERQAIFLLMVKPVICIRKNL